MTAAAFAAAVLVLTIGQLAARLVRTPQVTYSGNGTLAAYDFHFSQSIALIRGLEQLPVAWSWSPDGTHLAYVLLDAQGGYHLSVWSPQTRGAREIVRDLPVGSPPQWSPDGDTIAVIDANQDICLYPSAGGARRCLNVQPASQPVWSPDGRSIAYIDDPVNAGLQADVAVLNIETGEITRVTTHSMNDADPRWSPDGAWLAFVSDRFNGQPHLQVVSSDRLSSVEPLAAQGIGMVLYAYAWRP
jgi:Tol biopolymer transport system component